MKKAKAKKDDKNDKGEINNEIKNEEDELKRGRKDEKDLKGSVTKKKKED